MITYNICVVMLLTCQPKTQNTIYKYKLVTEFMNIGIKSWNNKMMKIACLSQQRSRFDSRSSSKWDLWCREWQWDRVLPIYVGFPLSVSFHQSSKHFIHLPPMVYNLSNWQYY